MNLRHHLSLDGQWRFWTDAEASLSPQTLHTRLFTDVTVPAPWQSQSDELRHYTGIAWYQCTFELPADWLNQRVILLGFGAADYIAEVWLNNVKVGEHEGGYLPFELEANAAARPGPNVLTVRIDDSLHRFAEIPHGKQSWYGQLSGLWQSVWVESRPATYIQHVHITPQGESVAVAIRLNNPLANDHRLTLSVCNPTGEVVAQTQCSQLDCQLRVSNPLLWDVDTPNLYTLYVSLQGLESPANADDSVVETFGFRTITTQNGQLLLNGRPLYLRSALDQDYYPELICTPPSVEFIEAQFRQAKAMGLNCLRTHIKITDPRYYAAADRLGLLIWTELPNHALLTEAAKRRAHETLAGMIDRDWNHPSIIIWTIINESWGIDLKDAAQRTWLAETYAYVKSLDPHRLVVGNSACLGNFHVVTDLEDFHIYYGMPDHYTQWRDWVANFATHPHWTFAHSYETAQAYRDFAAEPWNAPVRPPAPEVQRRGDEPLILSEFGNWGLPNLEALRASNGGHDPWWFETGLEWGEGVVYPHGVEERFKTFHLDRAFPTLSDLSLASQRLQVEALKYEIEQIRRHASIQGYVITEFTDVHWESNGLLDMYRHPKAITSALAPFNADDVLIPEWERLAFYTGETCELKVSLSHYSLTNLDNCQLQWKLIFADTSQTTQIQGEFRDLSPARLTVTSMVTISFAVPSVSHNLCARLEFSLVTKSGNVAATNYQDLYFFQSHTHSNAANIGNLYAPTLADSLAKLGYQITDLLTNAELVVATTITDELREYILRGGRVLWLAEADEAQQTVLDGLRLTPRNGQSWQGDWASTFSWLNRDQIFRDIPTNGVVNFAFAGITPDHVVTGFSPNEFAVEVQAGLFVGWLHKPVALVASRRLGRGEILISTFRLSQHLTTHPIAALMLKEMLIKLGAGHSPQAPHP